MSSLSIGPVISSDVSVRDKWLEACGPRPDFKPWDSLSSKEKHKLLHLVAAEADDDSSKDGSYLSAYYELDIDEMIDNPVYGLRTSVEHVLPRSFAKANPAAQNDPITWIAATIKANSKRSNLPLYLWPEDDGQFAIPRSVIKDPKTGEEHYVPPFSQRARLARKWIFARASYGGLDPPSRWQTENAHKIFALAKAFPPYPAEVAVNSIYKRDLNYFNPLVDPDANQWYDDREFRKMVMSA